MKRILLPACILLCLFIAGCSENRSDAGATPAATAPVGGASTPIVAAPDIDDGELEIPSFCTPDYRDPDGFLTLTMIGIGNADCFLLTLPDGRFILIDTGRKRDFDTIASALDAKGVTSIQTLVLTHGHKDHVGGLKKLLERYPVERICTAKLDDITFSKGILETIALSGADHRKLAAGETLDFGSVQIDVLAPLQADPENENNNSLVLRVNYLNTAFLLMGDAEYEVEQKLVERGEDLRADVLKVAHHGESDATGIQFLLAVAPRFAAVTGDDEEDAETLSPEILSRLSQSNIQFFTGKDFSTVDFISDGSDVTAQAAAG